MDQTAQTMSRDATFFSADHDLRSLACGHTQDRDENAANVMLVRAGFNPAGVDRVRREEPRVPLAA
jgi:transposase